LAVIQAAAIQAAAIQAAAVVVVAQVAGVAMAAAVKKLAAASQVEQVSRAVKTVGAVVRLRDEVAPKQPKHKIENAKGHRMWCPFSCVSKIA
jgi:hypothetical protein